MSKTIDQRVVEMRFDNSHFEKNTRETMSTLDKLKQKLNLSGASKGLENLNTSANKVDMKGMSGALDTVHAKFSAMEVIGVTALANITNSAVEAGKRMVNALTIAPVTDGWQEYEMTLNAIQTTMAGTGKTAEEVEKELKKLDEYADKTVYSTADMLNNLPKFTNAGVELESATKAMIGIANATALAGGDAGKASIAFYNLGQAIGTGYLTRMDYNSINNAGIATMEWKNQMVEAAIAAGTLKKAGEGLYSTGGEAMTIQQLFIDGLKDQWATTEVMMKVFEDYGDETTEIGKKAYSAAQDIKTFSQMMESLKATAGTGWKDTWQIIFGGLDEAKEFWTGLTNFISGIITGMADFRNALLEGALGRGFKKLKNALTTITKPMKKAADAVDTVTDALDYLDAKVTEVIRGNWGNGQLRYDKLTEAGYNYYAIQNKVNETLGSSFRYSEDLIKSQNELLKSTKEETEVNVKLAESESERLAQLVKMSDAELQALGLTKEQIEALRELKKYSDMTGLSIQEFVENIDEIDGRWLLINAFKNAGQGLVSVFKAIKDAWLETIGVMSSDQLFGIIASLHKFSTYLVVSEETADKLKRTLKGVFAVLDMIITLVAGPIKIGVKILFQFLKALDIIPHDILGFTATLGDGIVAVHDWIYSILDLTDVFEFLAPYIKGAAGAVREWLKGIAYSEPIQKFITYLRNAKKAVVEWFNGLKEAENIPKYIFEGLRNGLTSGAKGIFEFVGNIGKQIIATIKKVLGIHSPSTEFFEIGKNIMQGLFNGISEFVKMVYTLVMSIGGKIIEVIKSLDIGSIFTILTGAGITFAFVKIARAIDALTGPLEGLDYLFTQAGKTMKTFRGVLKSLKLRIMAESIKSFAVAIAILAGSVIALTLVDPLKMWSAVAAITVLMGVLAGLTAIASKNGDKMGIEFGKLALTLLALGVAMAFMASALKKIANIESSKYLQTISAFVIMIGSLMGIVAIVSRKGSSIYKAGAAFMGIATSLLMMAIVTKILGKMSRDELIQGTIAIGVFSGIIVGLMAATKLLTGSKNVEHIGKTISKVAGAILMMLIVAKIAGKMDQDELIQGTIAIGVFSGIIVGLMAATKLISGSTNVGKIGGAIFGIAGALLMMAFVAKIAASMEPSEILKGTLAIAAFGGIIVGLMAATRLLTGSKNVSKIGGALIAVSVAIGVMGLTAALLGMINTENLVKGVVAVGLLSAMVAGLIAVTHFAKNVKGTLIVITVAIGVLSLALAGLSMIDPTRLLGASIAIGVLLGMFALVIKMSGSVTKAMGTLIVLTVAIGVLAGALYLIAQLPINKSLAASISLSILLVSLSKALIILGVVGMLGKAAFIGIGALATLIVAIVGLIVGIGYLMEKIPTLQSFLNTGLSVLIQVAGGIGEMIGAFVSGALVQVSNALPVIGANLSLFMANATPFIVGCKMVDSKVLAGVGILAGSILALTAVNVIEGISSIFTLGGSFVDLGTKLSEFMTNALPFVMLSRLIDPTIMTGIKTLAEAILIFTAADLIDGMKLFGQSSLEKFSEQLPILGQGLKDFIDVFDGSLTEDQVKTANNAANIIKTLAQAASSIPNSGGLLASLIGDNDMEAWANQLPIMAKGIAGFTKVLSESGIGTDATTVTSNAADIIKVLASAASEIPNTGGWLADLVGDNDLSTFAKGLPDIGKGIAGFIRILSDSEITGDKIEMANTAAKIIKTLAEASQSIPNTGGWLADLVGDNDLSTFAKELPNVGEGIAGFASKLGIFDDDKLDTINGACKAIESFADLGNIDIKDTGKGLKSFGDNMIKFAEKIKDFVDKMTEVGTTSIESAIDKTKNIVELAKSVVSIDAETLSSFGNSLKEIAKKGVKGFVDEFTGKSTKTSAENAGKDLINAVIDGSKDKKTDAKKEFKKIAEAAVDELCTKTLKDDAKDAGKDLIQGLINGLKDSKKRDEVYNAAYSLGELAVQGEKDGQKSASPSKATKQAGMWLGEGLIIGIKSMGSRVYTAGESMGQEATNSISKALNTAMRLLDSDMDTQPTIRPVLDLSDVKSGAGYLNSMFNNQSIGLTSNLNAISSGMDLRLQNGTNDDVVSAINKLRKDISNVGGTTYNVNGITYDDGSNITDAVRTIVRAAKVERRI